MSSIGNDPEEESVIREKDDLGRPKKHETESISQEKNRSEQDKYESQQEKNNPEEINEPKQKSPSLIQDLDQSLSALLKVLTTLKKIQCQEDIQTIINHIDVLLENLPGPLTPLKIIENDSHLNWQEFCEKYFNRILLLIIEKFDKNFPFVEKQMHESVKKLFSVENRHFFLTCFNELDKAFKRNKTKDLARLLQTCLVSEGFFDFFLHLCLTKKNRKDTQAKDFINQLVSLPNHIANLTEGDFPSFYKTQSYSSFLLVCIIKTVEFLSEAIQRGLIVLEDVNVEPISLLLGRILMDFGQNFESAPIKAFIDVALISCSQRMAIQTENSANQNINSPTENKNSTTQSIYNKILIKLNRFAINKFITFACSKARGSLSITNLISSKVLQERDWKHVTSSKIYLQYRQIPDDGFIFNAIKLMTEGPCDLFFELTMRLLGMWSENLLPNQYSVEEHLALTKYLIFCLSNLEEKSRNDDNMKKMILDNTHEIEMIIMRSMTNHLANSTDSIRVMGMVTVDIWNEIKHKLKKDGKKIELNFDYKGHPEELVKLAQRLLELPNFTQCENIEIPTLDQCIEYLLQQISKRVEEYVPPDRKFRNKRTDGADFKNEFLVETVKPSKMSHVKIINSDDFQLDSDDELEPYDLSNNVPTSKKQAPTYLRDLRDGLLETKDPDIYTVSLTNCAKLVSIQLPDDDKGIGLEILEILVTLAPTFYLENFDELVFQNCVAVTCVYPEEYAPYLGKQVHAESGMYSICHRLLMLDVLAEASKTLSSVKPPSETERGEKSIETKHGQQDSRHGGQGSKHGGQDSKHGGQDSNHESFKNYTGKSFLKKAPEKSAKEKAQEIINERLELKTKRYNKHKSFKYEKLNKFGEVAGAFFFPLIHGFGSHFISWQSKSGEAEDNILLIRFLKTLSIIMCSTQNCVIAPRCAAAALNICWVLRFHKDPKVRVAVLSLITASLINVPKTVLLQDFLDQLIELRLWLAELGSLNVVVGEKNKECREYVAHVLCLVDDMLKVEGAEE